MIILDTSAVIEILKGTPTASKVKNIAAGEETAITSFTIHELMVNIKQREAQRIAEFLSVVKTYNFDNRAAYESALIEKRLSSKGKRIEESDIFIAGICIANGAKLITLDKGFLGIDGLEVLMP